MSLPSAYSLQKKETKKGMLMFISMPWTMATGTASGPEQRAMAARGNVGRTDARRRDRCQITEIFAEKGSSYQGGHFPEDIG